MSDNSKFVDVEGEVFLVTSMSIEVPVSVQEIDLEEIMADAIRQGIFGQVSHVDVADLEYYEWPDPPSQRRIYRAVKEQYRWRVTDAD